MRGSFGVMVLLLLVSVAHAEQCGTFGFYEINNVCVPDLFINWATVIAMISFLMLAMGYAIAKSLDSPRLTTMIQNELYQTAMTVVILAVYMGGLAFLNSIGPALYSTNLAYPGEASARVGSAGSWVGVQQHVITYVTTETNRLTTYMKDLSKYNAWLGMVSTLTVSLTISGQNYYWPIFPGFGSIQQVMGIVIGLLAASAVQLKAQLAVLSLWQGFFNVLLPFGIVLRMFPFTRQAGGAMIAIVFGFTFILPLMYLIIEDISTHYWSISGCQNKDKIDSSLFLKMLWTGVRTAIPSDSAFGSLRSMFGPGGVMGCIAFRAGIEAAILPMFAYLFALNGTRRLAELLGAEIELSSLVRII